MPIEKIEKIKRFISDIHNSSGKISKIILNKANKDSLKEIEKDLGFKCSSNNLGYFSFCIKYNDSKKVRYYFGQ